MNFIIYALTYQCIEKILFSLLWHFSKLVELNLNVHGEKPSVQKFIP